MTHNFVLSCASNPLILAGVWNASLYVVRRGLQVGSVEYISGLRLVADALEPGTTKPICHFPGSLSRGLRPEGSSLIGALQTKKKKKTEI